MTFTNAHFWKQSIAYSFTDDEWVYIISSMGSRDAIDGDGKSAAIITRYNKVGETDVAIMKPKDFQKLIQDLERDGRIGVA